MTVRFVKALTLESGVKFYAYIYINDDCTDTLPITKKSVRLMLADYTDDSMIKCVDWGDNNYLIG